MIAATALALFGFFGQPAADAPVRRTVEGWRIEARRDAFSGEMRCSLRGRDAEYARGALAFRFPKDVDTSNALYRLDAGPVRAWRDARLDLVRTGVSLRARRTANPSGGVMALPAAYLEGVSAVTIRPYVGVRPRTFRVNGLGQALATAGELGCNGAQSFPM